MRRMTSLLSVVVALMVATMVGISAQDAATPPAGEMEFPQSFEIEPGVVADNMLFREGAMEPSSYRLTYEPGAGHMIAPSPNLEVVYAESGSLTVTLDATVVLTRLGDVESGGEMVPAGTEFVLETGYFVVVQPGVSGEARNDGSEPAAISIAGLTPAGADMSMGTPAGTPAG